MHSPDDTSRQIGDLIRFGTVETVEGATVTVRDGDVVSPPLPWVTLSGGWILWIAPTVGQQVTLLCPSGDIEGAIVLNGLYSTAFPPPAEGLTAALQAPDGARFAYDPETNQLMFDLLAGAMTVLAAAGIELTAPVKITGDVEVTGAVTITGDIEVAGKIKATDEITSDTDVKAGLISLKNHPHPYPDPLIPGRTAKPVAA